MPKIPALNPLLQAWLLEGPLSVQVPAYVDRLRRGRYATHTSGRCLNGVAHFAHWMSMCHLPVHMLDEGCPDSERTTEENAMQTIRAMEKTGKDGMLSLRILGKPETEYEVLVVVQPKTPATTP